MSIFYRLIISVLLLGSNDSIFKQYLNIGILGTFEYFAFPFYFFVRKGFLCVINAPKVYEVVDHEFGSPTHLTQNS